MVSEFLRFPSGISVRRYRDQAKKATKAGLFQSYTHALNALSQQELGKNWDQALNQLKTPVDCIESSLYEHEVFALASNVIDMKCFQQDRLSESQLELLKKVGWRKYSGSDLYEAMSGIGLVALSHYYRSAAGSDLQKRQHPLFRDYMQHWIYSDEHFFDSNKAVLETLKLIYTAPSVIQVEKGRSYWLGNVQVTRMTKADISAVMQDHSRLNHFGNNMCYVGGESRPRRISRFENDRRTLLDAVDECNRACEFLHHVKPRKTIDWGPTSYGFKHSAEYYFKARNGFDNYYVSNGAFICAALHMGYRFEPDAPASPNACFNFSRRSVIFQWRKLNELRKFLSHNDRLRFEKLNHIVGCE